MKLTQSLTQRDRAVAILESKSQNKSSLSDRITMLTGNCYPKIYCYIIILML